MSSAVPPLSFIKRRPVLSSMAALLIAALLLAAFARHWVTTDSGRDFVVSQIEGRQIAGYGRLSVRKLEGDPLSEFSAGSLEIRDASGVWLSAKKVKVVWSPLALLSRTADLEIVDIAAIDVLRRPLREARPPSADNPWQVRLGRGIIDRLFLAEGVAGPEAALGVSARLLNERNGSLDATLQIVPLEGVGDRIEAKILRDRNSAFELQIDSVAPAGGVFAHLLELPEGSSAVLAATAAGDLDDGRGEARFSIDGADTVFVSAKIEDKALEAGLQMDAGALPIPENIAAFLGPRAEADLTVVFGDASASFDLSSRISGGTVALSGKTNAAFTQLAEPAKLKANLSTLAPFWDGARVVKLDGTLAKDDAGYVYSGNAEIAFTPGAGLPLEAVAGPVTLGLQPDRIPFSGDVVVSKAFPSNEVVAGILGDAVRVSGSGTFDLAGRRLLLDAAEVAHRSGTAQLLGEAGFNDRTLNLSGKVSQSLDALPGGFGGNASGFVQAKGTFSNAELGLNLKLDKVTSPTAVLDPLVNGNGTVRGLLQLSGDAGTIRRLDVMLPGLQGQVSGRAYGAGSPDLRMDAKQTVVLTIAGNQLDFGSMQVRLTRPAGTLHLTGKSTGGRANVRGRTVSDLSADASLKFDGNNFSGPIVLSGRSDGQPANASFFLERKGKSTRLGNVAAKLGTIALAGSATIGDDGSLATDFDANADAFEISGMTFGRLRLKGQGKRSPGDPLAIGGEFEARKIQVSSQLLIDKVTGTITTTAEGYRFEGQLVDQQPRANSDLDFSGLIRTPHGPATGRLSLSGDLLGIKVTTDEDIQWTLGPAPSLRANVGLLGGRIVARLQPGPDQPGSEIELQNIAIAPVLAALGLPAIDAVVSGRANGRFYGENPDAEFELSANSPVEGLSTAIDFDLTGRVDGRALTFAAQSSFGPEFKANGAGRLPVKTSLDGLVAFDRSRAMEALIEIGGELKALQLIALAYGHDIGGTLQSRTVISGSLDEPVVDSNARVTRGSYEYGATGLSLKDIALNADLNDRVLTIKGSGAGVKGGSLALDGRLARTESGINVNLDSLLVYDRLGDEARVSGDLKLMEGEVDRLLSGALTINNAQFNFDNYSNDTIRTLNVRWVTDDENATRQRLLSKPIRLGFSVDARSGVLIKGRGLDTNWGVDLDVSGRPDSLLLNGTATLVRGNLELAQRPFEFESGQINFDGPLSAATLAISATRDVDSFAVRADVGGTPSKPTIELSSTPSLPDDEILSRMLFGRSAVDLSALEAAELASSIARLSGRNTGLDPIGAIQSGLGVDRLRFGVDNAGNPELGVGQYLAPDVYLEVTTQGAAGNSVEVEWQPRPQVSVTSETSSSGDSRVSVRWKKDY